MQTSLIIFRNDTFPGHPRLENGKRLDENHVSKTSSSCRASSLGSLAWHEKYEDALTLASNSLAAANHL